MLVESNTDLRGASPVMCGVLSSFHPAAVEQTAVYISPNDAEEGRLWIKATRIPTMFQFRPTTRRFSMFVFVCVAGMGCWNGTMLDQVVAVEFSLHLL